MADVKTTVTDFSKKVIQLIKSIPEGKVATYGQIAELAGKPQGSRGVAWLLNSSSKVHKLPWQRVINSKGKISFPVGSSYYKKQKSLLKSEGVKFLENDSIDMTVFQWKKSLKKKKHLSPKKPQMFSRE